MVKITGPEGRTYQLGNPMYVHTRDHHIVTLDPVHVRNDGTEIHFEEFAPEAIVFEEQRPLGRLILFEIFAFIVDHFPQVQVITFSLSRPVQGTFGSAQHVASRMEVLQRAGIQILQVTPVTSGEHVITGIWVYTDRNIAALRGALQEQREVFRERPIGSVLRSNARAIARLRRMLGGLCGESS